jgi:orotate phosphoribosyltransferase
MALTQDDALQLFRESGAFLEGHFILTSGLHSPHYVEKFRVLEHPRSTARLCEQIAEDFRGQGVTAVVGPVTGGVILAHEVGKQLDVRAMFTERVDGVMTLRRGFRLGPDDRVLLVEDIVTTGGSIIEVRDVVRATGATVVGLGFLVDRSNGRVQFGVPARPLITLDVVTYQPDACPLCASGIPAVKPGSSGKPGASATPA